MKAASLPAMGKRETGVIPVRSRHCDKGVQIRMALLVSHNKVTDAKTKTLGRQYLCEDLSARKPASCLVQEEISDHE